MEPQTPLTTFKYAPKDYTDWWEQTKDLPEWAQQEAFRQQFGGTDNEMESLIGSLERIQQRADDPENYRKKLQVLRENQEAQMKAALPYKLMLDLPGQITSAFATPGAIRLAGAQNAASLAVQGLPGASIGGLNYQRPTIQYF